MTKAFLIPLSAAILLLPAVASARADLRDLAQFGPMEAVPIADLDLRTADGWHAAMLRLRHAAARVCAPQSDTFKQRSCRTKSLARATAVLARQAGANAIALASASHAGDGYRARP
ncbi:UrcA family protein [Sphingomonas sp. DT-51]|uniref:UrcA family protein n=1 Tax=Sphingomonas sp. DT-51 TaxID=3396165 RepID=UPI003F1DF996